MSYLVLARKYRPQNFAEVIGQEHVTRTLANAFAADRLHHAFLFCGPRGVGKTTLARILGKSLNCEKGPTPTPCGVCDACVSITNGSSVDYIEMDGASHRGIDAIRELTEAVRYQPAFLRKKVYVIDEVHMLTNEAFNALLKTLEEPPSHVVFVLATTEPQKIPVTILSRCQRYDCKLIPSQQLSQHLTQIFAKENVNIEPGAVRLLVRESGGSARDALSLSDQVISYVGNDNISEVKAAEVLGVADRSVTAAIIKGILAKSPLQVLQTVAGICERGVEESQIVKVLLSYVRDLAVLASAGKSAFPLIEATDEEKNELLALASSVPTIEWSRIFDRLVRCADDLGRTQLTRSVLEFALIDLTTTEAFVPTSELLDKLSAVEARLGGAPSNVTPKGAATPKAIVAPAIAAAPAPAAQAPLAAPPKVQSAPPPAEKPVVVAAPFPAPPPKPPAKPPAEPFRFVPPKAAEPPPPPAAPDSQEQRWLGLLEFLEERRKFALFGYFQHARVLDWTDKELTIGFSDEFHSLGEMAKERDKHDDMKACMAEHFKQPLELHIKLLSVAESKQLPARSVLETVKEKNEGDREERLREAREHPLVRLVENEFGADVSQIKTEP